MAEVKLLVDSCVFVDAFDPGSPNHKESLTLLTYLRAKDKPITMPAHAWFEVECALRKLASEKRFVGPVIEGAMRYPVELMHIDAEFIDKYSMADVPNIKAGDHIFLAVAKIDGYPLITSDSQLLSAARRCGVRVFEPKDLTHAE